MRDVIRMVVGVIREARDVVQSVMDLDPGSETGSSASLSAFFVGGLDLDVVVPWGKGAAGVMMVRVSGFGPALTSGNQLFRLSTCRALHRRFPFSGVAPCHLTVPTFTFCCMKTGTVSTQGLV